MIENKKDLKRFLKIERMTYKKIGYVNIFKSILNQSEIGYIYRYVKLLRMDEYYSNTKKGLYGKLKKAIIRRKRNIIGLKLGINIPINTFDIGLTIYHANGIIVNSKVEIGKYCKLHGNNCIGNDGKNNDLVPIIKDNVDIGVGAKIIGEVYIGNNTNIGANAVVLKGCYKDGAVLVGIPAVNKKVILGDENERKD